MKYLAFDLETTGIEATDKIICGVTRTVERGTTTIKHYNSDLEDVLSDDLAARMVVDIYDAYNKGIAIVTFNGAKFDFFMLAQAVRTHINAHDLINKIKEITINHYDIMYQFACSHGYFASMNSFAMGSKLAQKTWNGAEASASWVAGERRREVLLYCAEDVRVLGNLFEFISFNKYATRVTKAQKPQHVPFQELKTVQEASAEFCANPPDCSWMASPPPDILEGIKWLEKY